MQQREIRRYSSFPLRLLTKRKGGEGEIEKRKGELREKGGGEGGGGGERREERKRRRGRWRGIRWRGQQLAGG